MKRLILGAGRFLIDFGSFIQLILVILISIAVGISTATIDSGLGFLLGFVTFLLLSIIFIMSNYLFYLFLGIHDAQESMAKSLDCIARGTNSEQINSLKCPKCNKPYNEGDKFCEDCGTKLN